MDLLSKFGYTSLKPKQEEIIKSVSQGMDTIGVVHTGFGKSFTWQYYFHIIKKTVIVIQPLIALMEDQKQNMEKHDIPVIVFNSNNTNKKSEKELVLSGKPHIIYTSPEFIVLCEPFIRALVKKDLLGVFVVDECHCVVSWKEFRPEYNALHCLKTWAPQVNILALTATATKITIENITSMLKLKEPKVIMSSFQRTNLTLCVREKIGNLQDINYCIKLLKNTTGKTIVYCKTRKETDQVTEELKVRNVLCEGYHAGKSIGVRKKIQKQFTEDAIHTLVSTVAFGMGIDIPDIHLVIHYSLPKSIESMYQEIGRAGRDGKASKCVLMWNTNDIRILKFMMRDLEADAKTLNLKGIAAMEKYVRTRMCRMQHVCKFFGEDIAECNNCDVCLTKASNVTNKTIVDKRQDITKETVAIIRTLDLSFNGFGLTLLCDILYGSKSKNAIKMKYFETYGSLKHIKKRR